MAKSDMQKGQPEYDAYSDLFFFHRDFGKVESGNNQYWTGMLDRAAEINSKYKDTPMAEIVARHIIGLMTMWDKEVHK